MNNEDQIPQVQEPLVARDSLIHPAALDPKPGVPRAGGLTSEVVAQALKGALDSVSTARGRSVPTWESIPGIANFTAGQSPHAEVTPSTPSPTAPVPGGPAFDLNAASAGLGDLLAADPTPPDEARPIEGERPPLDRGPLGPTNSPGTFAGEIGPRQADGGTGNPGSLADHAGPVGLMSLVVPEAGAPDGGALSDGPGPDTSSSLPGRPAGVMDLPGVDPIALPGVNPIADQLALAPSSLESADESSEPSPYSVDIHGSAVSSMALGSILSGVGDSGSGVGSSLGATEIPGDVGRSIMSPDAWSGHAGTEGADQANSSSLDLSKTNELLQQLLDEVRKGRQPFLPLNDRNSSV